MNPLLTSCPVCTGELHITKLQCGYCGTALEGQFSLEWIGRLSREQLGFVELLVKNRGNINQVASDLGVSYTTARTRMDEIVTAMGYGPQNASEAAASSGRQDVLRRLATGELSAEQALRLLEEIGE